MRLIGISSVSLENQSAIGTNNLRANTARRGSNIACDNTNYGTGHRNRDVRPTFIVDEDIASGLATFRHRIPVVDRNRLVVTNRNAYGVRHHVAVRIHRGVAETISFGISRRPS